MFCKPNEVEALESIDAKNKIFKSKLCKEMLYDEIGKGMGQRNDFFFPNQTKFLCPYSSAYFSSLAYHCAIAQQLVHEELDL